MNDTQRVLWTLAGFVFGVIGALVVAPLVFCPLALVCWLKGSN